VAPFSGWVTRRYLDPGALVSPGPTSTILQLIRVETVRAYVNVLEKDVPLIRRGLPARVTVDALPGRRFEGTVTRFAPSLDPATRTLEVEVQIPNQKDAAGELVLKPGMYGHLALAAAVHPKAVVLPIEAVIAEEDTRFVYVVERAGDGPPKARKVGVTVGFDGGNWLEIAGGLTGGEQVVFAGIDLISDGAAVTIAGEKPPGDGGSPTANPTSTVSKAAP
jgi:membrane fusion protein (multidrug efflux system)